MFALRAIAVSLATFAVVYCASSLAVYFGWSRIRRWARQLPMRRLADLLFAVRTLPFILAAMVTAVFAVPSFLLLEPRGIDEPLGAIPLALGLCGAAIGVYGAANALSGIARASRMIASWSDRAKRFPCAADAPFDVPILRIEPVAPAMTAAGIIHPIIMVSGAAESLLAAGELQTALNHELAHVRRWDNLKKLLLRCVAFPRMSGLETAWLEATEMAADDAAVSSPSEALDLAAALIKLSRLATVETHLDLTCALVPRPASNLNARVERLLSWSEARQVRTKSFSLWYGLAAALGTAAICAVTYSQLLVHVHTATEWLVR
jgi:beta-lactamase regulating signal transducer with metallopeptidase domain